MRPALTRSAWPCWLIVAACVTLWENAYPLPDLSPTIYVEQEVRVRACPGEIVVEQRITQDGEHRGYGDGWEVSGKCWLTPSGCITEGVSE